MPSQHREDSLKSASMKNTMPRLMNSEIKSSPDVSQGCFSISKLETSSDILICYSI